MSSNWNVRVEDNWLVIAEGTKDYVLFRFNNSTKAENVSNSVDLVMLNQFPHQTVALIKAIQENQ